VSILSLVQAQRPNNRETLVTAAVFALQTTIAVFAVHAIYSAIRAPAEMWAMISAVLVLQAGFQQGLASSLTRFVANVVGAGVGVLVAVAWGRHTAEIAVALVIVVFACEGLRLDLGLRSACASTIIVMHGVSENSVLMTGIERAESVALGCGVAILLQLAVYVLTQYHRKGEAVEGAE